MFKKQKPQKDIDLLKLSLLKAKALSIKAEVLSKDKTITDGLILSTLSSIKKTVSIDNACQYITKDLKDYLTELNMWCDSMFNMASIAIIDKEIDCERATLLISRSRKGLYRCSENIIETVQYIVEDYDSTLNKLMTLVVNDLISLTERLITIEDEFLDMMK